MADSEPTPKQQIEAVMDELRDRLAKALVRPVTGGAFVRAAGDLEAYHALHQEIVFTLENWPHSLRGSGHSWDALLDSDAFHRAVQRVSDDE